MIKHKLKKSTVIIKNRKRTEEYILFLTECSK
jgi:hypothetical protein